MTGFASSQSLPDASSNGTVGWTGSHSRSAPRSIPSHRERPAARRDVIGNDMLFRAGQVPCRFFARAALLRQMQGSGWRSSDPFVATRPDRA